MIKKNLLAIKISIIFLSVIIILLVIVSKLQYDTSSVIVSSMIEKEAKENIEKSGIYIYDYVKKVKDISEILAMSDSINSYIDKDSEEAKVESLKLINNILSTDNNLVSVVLVTKDGRVLSNEESLAMKTSSNMMQESWYKAAIDQKAMPVLTSARNEKISKNKEDWVISVSQELVDEAGDNKAVIRLDISYKSMENYLKRLDLGENGYAFLIDVSGNLIYHTDFSDFQNQEKVNEIKSICEFGTGYNDDKTHYLYHEDIDGLDWMLVGVFSLDELDLIQKKLFSSFIIIFIISLIISVMIYIFLVYSWIIPIVNMKSVMKEIEAGNQEARAKIIGAKELKDLSIYFNRMLDQIDKLIEEIKDNEKSIRKYELESLSSQINPHFLYNTLDTIVWHAEFNNNKSVVELTKSLANLFRFSLNNGNEEIAIENELKHIESYLFIQKQRYGDKLSYEINCEESVKDFIIPKLIVQPIVENAIYHSIRELDRKGKIIIEAKENSGVIYLSVFDNGKGMPTLMKEMPEKKRSGGVGISNVNKRLKLFFGNRYKLRVDSKENEFTKIEFLFAKDN